MNPIDNSLQPKVHLKKIKKDGYETHRFVNLFSTTKSNLRYSMIKPQNFHIQRRNINSDNITIKWPFKKIKRPIFFEQQNKERKISFSSGSANFTSIKNHFLPYISSNTPRNIKINPQITPKTLYLSKRKNLFIYQPNSPRTQINFNTYDQKDKDEPIILKLDLSKQKHSVNLISNNTATPQSNNINIANYKPFKIIDNDSPKTIKSYYGTTIAGYMREGFPKINQDSFLILTNTSYELKLFGVFDGHGENGHHVSGYLKSFFHDAFTKSKLAKKFNNIFTPEAVAEKLSHNNFEIIKNLFKKSENTLEDNPHLKRPNCDFSGSTCNLVFIINDHLFCANTGDSRAILITEGNKVIELSRDHKPELKDECKRIESMGGCVHRLPICPLFGPFRVWLKNRDIPGLAMSRSIGDFVAESVGVICEPEVTEYSLNKKKAKCIILASDGVWQFTSNEKVKSIINEHYMDMDAEGAAKEIKAFSRKMWSLNGNISDDITVIVIYF